MRPVSYFLLSLSDYTFIAGPSILFAFCEKIILLEKLTEMFEDELTRSLPVCWTANYELSRS